MSNARFLVLGGRGQLGTELSARAALRGIPLVALGRDDVDITSRSAIRRAFGEFRPDVVVNAAAYTNVDTAEVDHETAWRVNCVGAGIAAAECALADIPLMHLSTDYVFDGVKPVAYLEADPVAPLGMYGASKAAGEVAVRRCWSKHLIIRTAWVYGQFGANFLKTIVRHARERDCLMVVTDQVGTPTATEDLADAVFAAGSSSILGSEAIWGTYHFAGPEDASRYEFARAIVELQAQWTGRWPMVHPIVSSEYPSLAKRPANSRLDSKLFSDTFGIKAMPWKSRLSSIVEIVAKEG